MATPFTLRVGYRTLHGTRTATSGSLVVFDCAPDERGVFGSEGELLAYFGTCAQLEWDVRDDEPRHRTFTLIRNEQSFPGTLLTSGVMLIEYPGPTEGAPTGIPLTPFSSEDALREAHPLARIIWHDQVPERIVIDADLLNSIVSALKEDRPFPVKGSQGRTYEIVAGDHESGETGLEHARLLNVELRGTGQ